MPTSGVPQITLEGSRDQNLRGGEALSVPPVQSRVKEQKFSDDFASKSNVDIREANIEL